MAGLLDLFTTQDPAKQQGLLAAAAALLQAGGPSRVPISTGQGLGAALGAYQKGFQGEQDRQQQQALYNIKLQDAQSDLTNQERKRKQEAEIAAAIAELNGPRTGDAASGGIQPSIASVLPDGPMSPKVGGPDWLQAFQKQNGPQLPSAAGPLMQVPNVALSGTARRGNLTQAHVQRLLAEADIYASHNDFDGASKRYQEAQKWMPQVERIETAWKDGNPVRVITYKDGSEEESQYGAKPDMVELDLGGTKQFVDRSRLQPGQVFNKTPTFAERNAAARLRFDQQQGGGDDATSFTQQAIDNAAARYNVDGSLPPMGMGKAGAAGRTKILNRAAELTAGVDPTQQRFDQLHNKGDVQARNTAVRSFATGKDGQAVQSANTALNHLDTIQQLAQAQKSGDVRAFNQAARSLGAAFGQTAPTNLNAALIMVAPEISKAVVGAGGTGHERDQALQALNPNGSPDQIIGATQTMQELFGGRLTEAKRTYERTTKLNDFDASMLSPAARSVLARAQQHGAGSSGDKGPGNIPAAAVSYLKQNPQLRNEFDAKFGAGAAASVLGK